MIGATSAGAIEEIGPRAQLRSCRADERLTMNHDDEITVSIESVPTAEADALDFVRRLVATLPRSSAIKLAHEILDAQPSTTLRLARELLDPGPTVVHIVDERTVVRGVDDGERTVVASLFDNLAQTRVRLWVFFDYRSRSPAGVVSVGAKAGVMARAVAASSAASSVKPGPASSSRPVTMRRTAARSPASSGLPSRRCTVTCASSPTAASAAARPAGVGIASGRGGVWFMVAPGGAYDSMTGATTRSWSELARRSEASPGGPSAEEPEAGLLGSPRPAERAGAAGAAGPCDPAL